MAGTLLTPRDQEKATILQSAIADKITNEQAAKQLRLSIRQVQRAKAEIRKSGIEGIIHKLKGKPSNHRYLQEQKIQVITAIKEKYRDFKPILATEKLQETKHIPMTSQTIRMWMSEAGLWRIHRKKKHVYFAWRERKGYFGELEQFDG